ncbi:MAG: ATP-binding protein [Cyanobacteria bacterium P01_D01_bin.6]
MRARDTKNELHTQIQYRLIEKLTESERRYRELVESLREIVFECDHQGHLTFINRAWTEILGYSVKDSIGQALDDFMDRVDAAKWQSLLQQQKDCCVELKFSHQNGEILCLELSMRFSRDAKLLGSLINVTERKQVEFILKQTNEALEDKVQERTSELIASNRELKIALQQLQQAQGQLIQQEKMSSLGQLVAGVAHEINNPVSFIHGNIVHIHQYVQDLLRLVQKYQEHYPNPNLDIKTEIEDIDLNFIRQDLPKILSSMETGSDRIREVVLSLRNFSRLDEAESKAVDLHEGIESSLVILNPRLKKGIKIVKSYDQLPRVECYPAQLNQVFMNILTNALDALQAYELKAPQITIRTEAIANHQVRVMISDNGPGIAPEISQKIFDPFFTTKPVGIGTGLGLGICYQIIERHQGQIQVVSSDKGAKFIITLPTHLAKTAEAMGLAS